MKKFLIIASICAFVFGAVFTVQARWNRGSLARAIAVTTVMQSKGYTPPSSGQVTTAMDAYLSRKSARYEQRRDKRERMMNTLNALNDTLSQVNNSLNGQAGNSGDMMSVDDSYQDAGMVNDIAQPDQNYNPQEVLPAQAQADLVQADFTNPSMNQAVTTDYSQDQEQRLDEANQQMGMEGEIGLMKPENPFNEPTPEEIARYEAEMKVYEARYFEYTGTKIGGNSVSNSVLKSPVSLNSTPQDSGIIYKTRNYDHPLYSHSIQGTVNGEAHGMSTLYYKNGNIATRKFFEYGKCISEVEYSMSGKNLGRFSTDPSNPKECTSSGITREQREE